MDQATLIKLAAVGAGLYMLWKHGPAPVAAMALAVGGVAVAKQLPYVKDVLA